MTPNNAFERTGEERGPRLAAARSSCPAAQLDRLGIQLSRLYSSKRPSSVASARFGAFAGMKLRTKPKA